MMRKIILFLLIFTFNNGFSQNKTQTLLWKVTKPQSDKISYLFGTFHQVNPDFFDSLASAKKDLLESEVLFVETYKSGQSNTSNSLSDYFEPWNKEKWKSNLTKSQLDVFEKFSASKWVNDKIYSVDPTTLMFILQNMYFQGICDTANRKSYEKMDDRIVSIGLANKLTIIGLDNNQFLEIQKSSKEDKALALKNTINSDVTYIKYILGKNTDNPFAKTLFDYKNQDLDYKLNIRDTLLETLLNGRNNKWITKLTKQFDTKNCFVAVGFRHLFYKDGLIQQLRRKGYLVEPIYN